MTRVVGIGGTLRAGASSERLARAVLDRCAEAGADVQMFDGPDLAKLPHYDPGMPVRCAGDGVLIDTAVASQIATLANQLRRPVGNVESGLTQI